MVWDPNVCVPKMARPEFPSCKLRFFPWSLWSLRGGGGGTTFAKKILAQAYPTAMLEPKL